MLGGGLYEGTTEVAPVMTGNGGTGSGYPVPTGVRVDLEEPILFDPLGAGNMVLNIATDLDDADDNFKFWVDYTRPGI